MFKRGDIVQVKPEFCDVGEDDFLYRIIKVEGKSAVIADIDYPAHSTEAPQQTILQGMIELSYPQRG
jgi:hypothetical protein